MPRRLFALAAAVTATLVVGSSAAAVTPPVPASAGPSPFDACVADNVTLQEQTFGSTLSPGSEVEPRSAINPANHLNIVAEYQQDRWSDGGARGLVASVTHDGGTTWDRVVVPGLTKCSGGTFDRASDPWVTFGADGSAYAISLSFDAFDAHRAILVSKSADGGETWGAPTALVANDTFLDKESITADPNDANVLYAAWDALIFPGGSTNAGDQGIFHSRSYKSQTFVSRSTDGGRTWSSPAQVFIDSSYSGSIGSIIRILPDGTVLDGLVTYGSAGWKGGKCASISMLRSTDHGATWSSKPVIVAPLSCTYFGAHDPDTGADVRSGALPDFAIFGGTVYAAWEDELPSAPTTGRILFSQSTDGGATWTAPTVISRSPAGVDAFTPTIAVNAAGRSGSATTISGTTRRQTGSARRTPGSSAARRLAPAPPAGRRHASRRRRSTSTRPRTPAASSSATTRG